MPDSDPLTPAMFHILLALAGGARHGYAIMQDVMERTEGQVDLGPGTLYRSIRRLVDNGLIDELASGGNNRRRPYRITSRGREAAGAEARRLARSVDWARSAKLLGDEQ